MLNFNRANLSERTISTLINELIEKAEPPSENYRQYLGASAIGAECLRKVQYDWMCDPVFPGRIKDIFARGHFFEEITRQHLIAAGFQFALKTSSHSKPPTDSFAATPTARSSQDQNCRHLFIRAYGNTNALAPRAGRQSSAMVWSDYMRPTRVRLRSIKRIWISPILRFSVSSMPIPLSVCTSLCRSMRS
jgi:hypothetical protein